MHAACAATVPPPSRRASRVTLGVMVHATEAARKALHEGEALVFDWYRVAICCAAAGEVSLRRDSGARLAASPSFRRLEGELPIYAHRMAYPHLVTGCDVTIDCTPLARAATVRLRPPDGLRSASVAGPTLRSPRRNPALGLVPHARIDVDVVDLPVAAEQRRELEAHRGHVGRQQRQQVGEHQVRQARVPRAAEVDADRQRDPRPPSSSWTCTDTVSVESRPLFLRAK